MQHQSAQEHQGAIEMSLREHLLAAGAASAGPAPYPPPAVSHQAHDHPYHHDPDAPSPHAHHLDPNVTGVAYGTSNEPGDDGLSPDARKGKRELSTSKRAAQNRAAQRAFRQRKEGYIKKLEEQVKEFQNMESNYKALQNENYQLREYILNLQSRLLESQSEFPPAPSHINLTSSSAMASSNGAADASYGPEAQLRREIDQQRQPGPPPPAQVTAREDPIRHDGLSQLQAAAVQGGDLRPQASPYAAGTDYSKRLGADASAGVMKTDNTPA